ncbi:MAG TPA: hypothetical protein GXZ36_09370 [Firmicutes bacterium]|nr:hypothetical protein [Bacillota bacterium]
MNEKPLAITGGRRGVFVFILLTVLVGGMFQVIFSGEPVRAEADGQEKSGSPLLFSPGSSTNAPESEDGAVTDEYQEPVGLPEINLPQWLGSEGLEAQPGCYYEINSGVYLGICRKSGFLVSYNNGITWEEKNNGLPRKNVYPFDESKVRQLTALGVDPVNNERLAVTTATGLYISTDFGENWQQIKTIPPGVYLTAVALSPHDPATIAVGTAYSGIFESKDFGASWRRISGGLYFLRQARYTEEISALTYHPGDSQALLFACGFGKGLYRLDRVTETASVFSLPPTANPKNEEKLGAEKSSTAPEAVIGLHFRLNASPPAFWLQDDWVLEVVTTGHKRSYSSTFMSLLKEEVKKGRTRETLSAEAEARRRKAADKYGIYVNYAWKRFEDHLPFIKKHNLNSIVVDFKNDQGLLTYNTKLALPNQIGAVSQKFRIEELIKRAHANGVYVIGRVVVFKDRQLHKYNNHQYALWDKVAQKPWVTGEYWVDPFSAEVWEYNIAIAKELEELGVDEVQFDYIRFPTDGDLSRIAFRHRRPGMLKVDALESFLAMARENLEIPISVDLYGFNCWYRMEGLTGQNANIFSDYVDVISPMFYPSHFPGSFYGKETYNKRARLIYEEGVARAVQIVEDRCLIRPYVQAFLLGGELRMKAPQYTQYLLEQIKGTLAAPSSGFTLWNNSNNYYMVKQPLGHYIPEKATEQESGVEQ